MFYIYFPISERNGNAEKKQIVFIAFRLAFTLRCPEFFRIRLRFVVIRDVLSHVIHRCDFALCKDCSEIVRKGNICPFAVCCECRNQNHGFACRFFTHRNRCATALALDEFFGTGNHSSALFTCENQSRLDTE